MSVRYGLSIGEDLDKWIKKRADDLGIAKNAFVIMCVANARQQAESYEMMSKSDLFKEVIELGNKITEKENSEKE